MNINERDVMRHLNCDQATAIGVAAIMSADGFDWSESTHAEIKRTAKRVLAERKLAQTK